MGSPSTLARINKVGSLSVSGNIDGDIRELDVPQGTDAATVVKLFQAKLQWMRSKNRELERGAWTSRSELKACRAALSESQAEASHVWQLLKEAENQLRAQETANDAMLCSRLALTDSRGTEA